MDRIYLAPAYRLISELFLYPDDRDEALVESELAKLGEASAELRAPIDAFLTAPLAKDAGEYVATLELAPLVPLYLGSYLFEEPNSCRGAGMSGRNAYMLELSNIYRHFGVEFAGREMSDFVPVIVEFLGISLERADNDQIGLRRYLMETLLIDGIEKLMAALEKCESPYAKLIEALLFALNQDIAQMAGRPKWQPPVDEDGPPIPAVTCDLMAPAGAVFEKEVEL